MENNANADVMGENVRLLADSVQAQSAQIQWKIMILIQAKRTMKVVKIAMETFSKNYSTYIVSSFA